MQADLGFTVRTKKNKDKSPLTYQGAIAMQCAAAKGLQALADTTKMLRLSLHACGLSILCMYIYIYMLLGSFGAPQSAHFGPVLRVHLRPPPKKKPLVPQNGAYGEQIKGSFAGPPKSSFEAPQNLVSKGPISGGRKWTHGGPQMNASKS